MIDKLRVDVFVDTGHAEDVPTVVNIEKDISIEILIVLSVTLSTFDYFCLIDCQVFIDINLINFTLFLGNISWRFLVVLIKYIA